MLRLLPARDQGKRSTCAAFALASVFEYRAAIMGWEPEPDLSEQFLFWAALSPLQATEPTRRSLPIRRMAESAAKSGTCREGFWPYDPTNYPSFQYAPTGVDWVTHADSQNPSAAARADAEALLRDWELDTEYGSLDQADPPVDPDVLAEALRTRGPVALSLPRIGLVLGRIDEDPWMTDDALEFGLLTPSPGWAWDAAGRRRHSVCVVGSYDDTEPGRVGRWFVFRNSWGVGWAERPPPIPANSSPFLGTRIPPGYGRVSAGFIREWATSLVVPAEPLPAERVAAIASGV